MHGQEEKPVATYDALEGNRAQSLWFASSNAAGMAITPLYEYNLLEAQYNVASGHYKLQQQGDRERKVGMNVDGALQLGKFFLWGNFTFSDDYTTGSSYNTNRYESQPDMPYYVADTVKSDWKKQYYDMTCKVAFPLTGRIVLGGEIRYITRKAAKQLDPRSVLHNYAIELKPALIFSLNDRSHLGLNFLYQNTFDRNTFTNSLSDNSERVYIMKGLGNYSTGVIGGLASISPFYYPSDQYGAGLQYDATGTLGRLLAEITYTRQRTDAFEAPTKPRRRGATQKTEYEGYLQWLKPGVITHKATLHARYSSTDGIEYLQEYNSQFDINQWITIAQYVKSAYSDRQLSLRYDLYSGTPTDYSWKTGVNANYTHREDEYFSPQSLFNARNIYTETFAARRFLFGPTTTFHAGLNVGYRLNLDGEYLYNVPEPTSPIVQDFFTKDLEYLTTNYLQAGCNLYLSLALPSDASVNFKMQWQWINPSDNAVGDRHVAAAGIAYLF
jgi:hypothetical protein